ncbi:MAG: hypothetical protein H7831_09650 [Magnetococcus sp. WYHC-3]
MQVARGNAAHSVRQAARFRLWVEGKDEGEDSLDVVVLKCLLPEVDLSALGASFHVESVAQALLRHRPDDFSWWIGITRGTKL